MKKGKFGKIEIIPNEDLIFDDKVKEQCKHCKRFGKKSTCPPFISSEYYEKLLS